MMFLASLFPAQLFTLHASAACPFQSSSNSINCGIHFSKLSRHRRPPAPRVLAHFGIGIDEGFQVDLVEQDPEPVALDGPGDP